MKTFIYGLFCPLENTIKYVGKSNCPRKRYNQHKHNCHSSKYENTHMKNWWLKLEALNLKPALRVLEEVDVENWPEREIFWIKYYGRDKLCNKNDGGFEPPNRKGKPLSVETKALISDIKKGVPIWVNGKIHPMKGRESPTKGSKRSQEFRDKCRASKLGSNNPNFGKKIHPNLASALHKVLCKEVHLIGEEGSIIKTYESCIAAEKELGLSQGAVSRVCNGVYKQTKGYKFKFKQ